MDYGSMSHSDLLRLRWSLPENSPLQREIAPYEHAAFAREWTQENPALAVPSLAVAIPGYALAKLLGLKKTQTPASLRQVAMGYRGVGQGLAALMRGNT